MVTINPACLTLAAPRRQYASLSPRYIPHCAYFSHIQINLNKLWVMLPTY
ncbi:hypothetical protein ExPEC_0450 [Escherichia coli]|nr:hypothetical protein HMPREF1609_04179 [Escherichia coli 908541]KQL73714.1 hypothetical protein ExPEC_0450 [Escherichia coli]